MHTVIHIHPAAPDKPLIGAPCNGCGVCCAAAPCPVSALVLKHRQHACPALMWIDSEQHYRCGIMIAPSRFIPWLPQRFERGFTYLARRWLALGIGCDSNVEMEDKAP